MFLLKYWRFHLILFVSTHLSLHDDYSTPYISNNPYRKNSGAVWSGKQGDHVTSLKWEITRRGNKWWSAAMLITVMWAVAPSCLNHKLWFGGSFGAIEVKWSSLCNTDVAVMACLPSSSKKLGPVTPLAKQHNKW